MKILVIEDQKDLLRSIIDYMQNENYLIDSALNFIEAQEKINLVEYDCALVDIMLPDGSGLDIVKSLKRLQPKCGVIFITAKNTLDDKLNGLNLGADDYISKPFHLAELNARINSVIRRLNFDGNNEINFNEIIVDTSSREVFVNNKPIDLTKREYEILIFFLSNKDRVLTKEAIVEHLWGDDSNTFDNFDFIYTHIKNLRKKIVESGSKDYIKSVYGVGYKMSSK